MLNKVLALGIVLVGGAGVAAILFGPASIAPPLLRATPMTMSLPKTSGLAHIQIVDPTPRRLVIASIGVDAVIEARGLDSSRNMQTPSNFRDVAWYRLGPVPGQPGNALINGHVNWWTGDAVFTRLGRVRVGDVVTVIRGDGGETRFKVTGSAIVAANARVAWLFAPSHTATLTLITCSGVWNPLTQSDTRRLLVSAVLA